MGRSSASTSLMPQLVQAVIPPQHGAFVDSKGSVNLLRINCVLPTSSHTRRGSRGQNECHLSMSVLGNISTAFLGLSVDGNISTTLAQLN